jgi:hypothetical protein
MLLALLWEAGKPWLELVACSIVVLIYFFSSLEFEL